MAFNKKPSETGWFYHAPAKVAQGKEPVAVPPPSQIPGLDGHMDYEPEEQKQYIKESDSAYIRLAKQGGRPNLLQIAEPKPRQGPAGYPRCEWYYDEDMTDEKASEQPYQFLLPDYMVHPNEREESGDSGYAPRRLPYGHDTTTVYDREGNHATDKTVRLPEVRQPGYGVRQDREPSNAKQPPVVRTQACKPPAPHLGPANTFKPMPVQQEDERPPMGKLLSNGYLGDWQKDREEWTDKQDKKRLEANRGAPSKPEKHLTEYQESLASKSRPSEPLKPMPRKSSSSSTSSQHRKQKPSETMEKPDIFKLSKFKNVASKTDSHRIQGGSDSAKGRPVVAPIGY